MDITVQPFKKWGDLFIIQDYEATIGHECPNYTLGGLSPTNEDFIEEVFEAIGLFISCKVDAVMIELSFLNDLKRMVISRFAINLLKRHGYKDLESYENRLAFGRF